MRTFLGVVWLVFAFLVAPASAQSQVVTHSIGDWAALPISVDDNVAGVFLWRHVTAGSGECTAFYFEKSAGTWDRWLYPGDDLGAAVIEAGATFTIEEQLMSNEFLAAIVKQRQNTGDPLPSTAFIEATNGFVEALTASGLFTSEKVLPEADKTFTEAMIGDDPTLEFGVRTSGVIDYCEPPIDSIDLIGILMDDLAAHDETGLSADVEGIYETHTNCGAWSAWTCGPWTVSSNPVSGGFLCVYSQECTRERLCRRSYWVCGYRWGGRSWYETETSQDSITCWSQNNPCPAVAPGTSPPPVGCE